LTTCSLLLMINATVLFAQWEWAGGIPASYIETVGAAGRFLAISGRYADTPPVCSRDGGDSWFQASGIGPYIYSPVVMASGADTSLLAIGYSSSVYRLRDTARAWVRSDSGLGGALVRGLAYLKTSGPFPNGVAVAVSPVSGIFVSTDLGAHWSSSDSGLTAFNAVTVVALDSAVLVGTGNRGVFRSVDGALTWLPANSGLADTNITVLATGSGWFFAASGTNIYRSSDGGGSWSHIPGHVPAAALNLIPVPAPGKGIGVVLIAVTSSGYYRLAPEDSSWVLVKAAPTPYHYSGDIPFTMAVVDTVLYAADYDRISCSTDLGTSWFQVGCGVSAEITAGPTSSKNSHPRLYSGPFVSTNFGSRWVSLHQAYDEGSHVAVLSVSPDTSALGFDRLTIGTDSGAVEFSDDGGKSWKVVHDRQWWARGHGCFDVAELDGVIFASLQGGNPYYHSSSDTVSGVYRTTTAGGTWEKMNTVGLTDTLVGSLDLFRGRDGGRILFAGTWYNLFRSTNDGESWTANSSVRSGRKALREVNGALYLCTGGTVRSEYDNEGNMTTILDTPGVYRSTDQGISWIEVNGNLHPPRLIRGFAAAAAPLDPGPVFLAVSMDGTSSLPIPYAQVLTSTQGGKQWCPFTENLPPDFTGAPMGADDRFVYCMGRRRPWSEAELTSVGPEHSSHATTFSLSQNYPNPFNPSTRIEYTVVGTGGSGLAARKVELRVYDVLGREVAVLVNEQQMPGNYNVQFDGSKLCSGVYFYRLMAGPYLESRKMLLLK
jgi:photosystem II stability/assembly factor-like uncharacterized protein